MNFQETKLAKELMKPLTPGNVVVFLELQVGYKPNDLDDPRVTLRGCLSGNFGGKYWFLEIPESMYFEYPYDGFYEQKYKS